MAQSTLLVAMLIALMALIGGVFAQFQPGPCK
jgi:hypothetical protein